uniref:BCL2 antagonist/killer 1 n=1 Tax=Amazona collaria TaxID=241587 RepID=A0A8B9FI91_9PSIT
MAWPVWVVDIVGRWDRVLAAKLTYLGFAPHLVPVNLCPAWWHSQRSRDLIPPHHFCPLQILPHERDPGKSRASDQVAEETEEVFRSYAFYRYEQEREDTGSLVGQRLAIIGDDINKRYDAEFRYLLKSLQPTKENAYECFTRVASSLFESGINWGRVIALLGFGYRMAIHVYQQGRTGFLRWIAHCVVEFMLRNRIARWIAQQGGWAAALDLDNVSMKYMLVMVALVMVVHLVVRRFFKP